MRIIVVPSFLVYGRFSTLCYFFFWCSSFIQFIWNEVANKFNNNTNIPEIWVFCLVHARYRLTKGKFAFSWISMDFYGFSWLQTIVVFLFLWKIWWQWEAVLTFAGSCSTFWENLFYNWIILDFWSDEKPTFHSVLISTKLNTHVSADFVSTSFYFAIFSYNFLLAWKLQCWK